MERRYHSMNKKWNQPKSNNFDVLGMLSLNRMTLNVIYTVYANVIWFAQLLYF